MEEGSAYMKSSHQFLPGLHRELWIHAAENFFPALPIHGCQVAHQFVARSPFRILAQTDTDRQKRGDDPNSDICRRHGRNKEAKRVSDNPTAVINSGHRVFHNRPRLAQTDEAGDRWVITVPACNGDCTM